MYNVSGTRDYVSTGIVQMRKFKAALVVLFVLVSFDVNVCHACASFGDCLHKYMPSPKRVAPKAPPTEAELEESPISCPQVRFEVNATNMVQAREICVECARTQADCGSLAETMETLMTSNGLMSGGAAEKALYAKCCKFQ